MKISKDKVVSIEYTLKDKQGEVLDSSEAMGPLEYIHGHENIIPGLEKALAGKKAGDKLSVVVEPADAYGEFQDELLIEVPKAQFQADGELEVGMQFEAGGAEGTRVVTVTKIEGDTVTIDANHPLAGEKLFFDVEITNVRDATEDELAEGLYTGCGCGCGDDDDCGGDSCGCGDDDDEGCSGGCCGCGH